MGSRLNKTIYPIFRLGDTSLEKIKIGLKSLCQRDEHLIATLKSKFCNRICNFAREIG